MIKKRLLYYIVLVATLFFSSCSNNKKKYKIKYYLSGSIKSSGWYLKDSIWVDTMYNFYENGHISSIEVRNDSGVLNGESKFFYKNGELFQVLNYTNGIKTGFGYEFKNEV